MEKLTKKDYFKKIMEVCANDSNIVTFCEHEIELLEKKNSKSAPSKTQVENESIKAIIIEELANIAKPVTITELQNASERVAEYSNQKLSALLKQLVETKQVVKTTDKKKSLFSIAE